MDERMNLEDEVQEGFENPFGRDPEEVHQKLKIAGVYSNMLSQTKEQQRGIPLLDRVVATLGIGWTDGAGQYKGLNDKQQILSEAQTQPYSELFAGILGESAGYLVDLASEFAESGLERAKGYQVAREQTEKQLQVLEQKACETADLLLDTREKIEEYERRFQSPESREEYNEHISYLREEVREAGRALRLYDDQINDKKAELEKDKIFGDTNFKVANQFLEYASNSDAAGILDHLVDAMTSCSRGLPISHPFRMGPFTGSSKFDELGEYLEGALVQRYSTKGREKQILDQENLIKGVIASMTENDYMLS
jgi:hypothetical protein